MKVVSFLRMMVAGLAICLGLGLSAGVASASTLPTFTLTGNTWDATFGSTYSGSFADVYNFSSPGGGTVGGTDVISGRGTITGFNTRFSLFSLFDATTSTTLASGSTGGLLSFFNFVLPDISHAYALYVSGQAAPGYTGGSYAGSMSIAAVPEPETYAMLLAGLGLLLFTARRRTNNGSQSFA